MISIILCIKNIFCLVLDFLKTNDVDYAYFTNFLRECIVLESHYPLKTRLVKKREKKTFFCSLMNMVGTFCATWTATDYTCFIFFLECVRSILICSRFDFVRGLTLIVRGLTLIYV